MSPKFQFNNLIVYSVLCASLIALGASLRIVYFFVPRAVEWGKSATLQCHYDVENDRLHRITWAKDDRRFFRFSARDNKSEVTNVKGVHVDSSKSNSTHVTIDRVDADSDGIYSCEVQTKGPAFKTVFTESKLSVFYLPKDSLYIEGVDSSYKENNLIRMTCISRPSFPVTKLLWTINGETALPKQVSRMQIITQQEGLKVSKLELKFAATRDYFRHGSLRLNCLGLIVLEVGKENKTIGDFS
ncbi:uncharacterized protein B4U79_09052, partial [Dinothrombium tinctorium]